LDATGLSGGASRLPLQLIGSLVAEEEVMGEASQVDCPELGFASPELHTRKSTRDTLTLSGNLSGAGLLIKIGAG
jgi:hypothetical protein